MSINNDLLGLNMDESKKVRILFISLRSDYGGGPSHMYDLVTSLSSSFEKYVACPDQQPYFNRIIREGVQVFELPCRKLKILIFINY